MTSKGRPACPSAGARARLLALAVLAAAALLVPSASFGVASHSHVGEHESYDSRTAWLDPTAAQQSAADALGATVRWNRFGTPQSVVKHGGFLTTGVQAADAESAARSWLDANGTLFRLTSTDDLALHAVTPLAASDAQAVILRQQINGVLTAPDGLVVVGLVPGEAGWNVAYASSSLTGDDQLAGARELSMAEALSEAADEVDADIAEDEISPDGRQAGWTRFEVEDLDEPQYVRYVAFPTPQRGVRRAYETVYFDGVDDGYQQIVDAATGDVLLRESIVHNAADNPKWSVFPAFPQITPLNRYPWNYPSADTRDLWCWFPAPGCKLAVENPAARVQWDTEPRTQTPTFTTIGNAAESHEAWFGGAGTGYRPTSPTRDYTYPWTNQWFEMQCDPAAFETPERNDIDPAVANLFAMHWKLHDWQYHLGFTERTWNAQDYNFGEPFAENDPLEGRAQSGAIVPKSRDNANMATRPDGISSLTNMFLWQPLAAGFYAPCVDGDYDQAVIGHEYGHMTENRMISKGLGSRQGFHAGAMGESFGDLNAMEYLNEYDYVPVGGESPYAVGAYATGNPREAIRNYNMSFRSGGHFPQEARYPDVNPLNFSDVGYDIVGPQVHADGEIWSATNFDIRELLLDRYRQRGHSHQLACAEGERPVTDCPGNRRWIQLYFDAMLLMPRGPTFLDARDAILAADVMRFGGANQDLLWLAFARRGFGEHATTTSNNDTEPRGNWESPLHGEETLTFNAVAQDEGNRPITNFRVYQGDYEARVTPLNSVERFVPDDSRNFEGYNFIAHAEGYGHVRFYVKSLKPGEARTITIRFATNWASQSQGATATGDGTSHQNLIDDTEGTNWQSTDGPVQGKQVVVQLAGPQRFRLAKASALLIPGQNRFTALRQFELYACTAGGSANPTCDGSSEAGWRRILRSHKDAFPAVNPRPVAPELHLRTFQVPTTTATHVRFVVLNNQCTGNPDFQGEQDLDPTNPTDCRATAAGSTQVRATELQLLSSTPRVDGAQTED